MGGGGGAADPISDDGPAGARTEGRRVMPRVALPASDSVLGVARALGVPEALARGVAPALGARAEDLADLTVPALAVGSAAPEVPGTGRAAAAGEEAAAAVSSTEAADAA